MIIAGNSFGVAKLLGTFKQLCLEFGPYIVNKNVAATFTNNLNQIEQLKENIEKTGKLDLKGLDTLFKKLANDTYTALLNKLI